jgi:acyl-CoA synthetase (AMP-forming)/AMP-acid ligase II
MVVTDNGFRRPYVAELTGLCPDLVAAEPGALFSARFPYLRRVVDLSATRQSGAVQPWADLLDAGASVDPALVTAAAEQVWPADDAIVIYTSGTTALPKGVLHAHRGPATQMWRFGAREGLRPDDRVYSAFPFFWTAGLAMVMGATLVSGGCLVLHEVFDAGEALRLMETERVTVVHAWPHQANQIHDHPDAATRDLSSLRLDPGRLRPEKDHAEGQTVDNRSQAGYGMSETFTIVSSAPVDAPIEVITGSHGPVLPGNAVRVLDPDTGEPRGVGAEGELAVKGRTLMRGYLKLPPEAAFDDDGFFHSGDTGYVDADGLVHWTGRSSDLIKTGGANVSPVELENVLLRHPGLAAAVAVGVPDPLLGERVVAFATARPGAEVTEAGVREFAAALLASYKVPRHVLFFSAAELPLTGTDKIQLAEVRARAIARLDADMVAS